MEKITLDQITLAILFVYAPSVEHEKSDFWHDIITCVHKHMLPVLIIGDLNDIEKLEVVPHLLLDFVGSKRLRKN